MMIGVSQVDGVMRTGGVMVAVQKWLQQVEEEERRLIDNEQ